MDYAEKADSAVRTEAVSIAAPFADRKNCAWHQAAAIFDHVYANIKYVPDPRGNEYVASPAETLKCGGGDCDDHAVLLASLCEAIGVRTRVVTCTSPEGGHALCQIDFGKQDPTEVADTIRNYYREHQDRVPTLLDRFRYEYGDDAAMWLFCDTAMGHHFGDTQALVDDGFISARDDGTWRWAERPQYFDPPEGR